MEYDRRFVAFSGAALRLGPDGCFQSGAASSQRPGAASSQGPGAASSERGGGWEDPWEEKLKSDDALKSRIQDIADVVTSWHLTSDNQRFKDAAEEFQVALVLALTGPRVLEIQLADFEEHFATLKADYMSADAHEQEAAIDVDMQQGNEMVETVPDDDESGETQHYELDENQLANLDNYLGLSASQEMACSTQEMAGDDDAEDNAPLATTHQQVGTTAAQPAKRARKAKPKPKAATAKPQSSRKRISAKTKAEAAKRLRTE